VFPNGKRELSAGCTKKRCGGLRKRAGRAVEQFDVQPAGPPLCATHRPVLWCSLPARSSVQLASPRIIHVFHLATRPARLAGPQFSVILFKSWSSENFPGDLEVSQGLMHSHHGKASKTYFEKFENSEAVGAITDETFSL